MNQRILRALKFLLERWIQQGVLHQLLLMAALIGLISVSGGAIAWLVTDRFEQPFEAAWWAFLRLTDPGYLGDDEGVGLRIVSTVLTVLGYVVFMGSLIAILTQWLARTIRALEQGLTPITMGHHIVILGWTNRTLEIVLTLLEGGERLRQFLDQRDVGRLRIVVLSDEVDAERRRELRAYIGSRWKAGQIFLRSGSSLRPDDLQRLDLARAAVLVVPGADFELGGVELSDTRVVKTLLTIRSLLSARPQAERPQVIAEVFDPLKISLARECAGAPIEIVSTSDVIARLISQSIRHRGLARVLVGILCRSGGSTLYVRSFPELAGATLSALSLAFRQAVVLGILRRDDTGHRTYVDPDSAPPFAADDLLVLLSESYERCVPGPLSAAPPIPLHEEPPRPTLGAEPQKVLVLGWSHKLASLLDELDQPDEGRFDITVFSRIGLAQREEELRGLDGSLEHVRIRHLIGDYSIEKELMAVHPGDFDNVLFFASDWLTSAEEADARTVLGYHLLRTRLPTFPEPPEILVELLDPDTQHLFDECPDTVIVSPRVLSHLLAQVALRPELGLVYDELFGAGGAEIELRPAADFGLRGPHAFPLIQRATLAHDCVALGLVSGNDPANGVHLNPDRERIFELGAEDQVVVVSAR